MIICKMVFKNYKTALLVAFLLVIPTIAGNAQQSGGNMEAFTFLRLDRSPVTSAMAGAGFSMTNGNLAYAAFGNPAATAFMTNKVSAAVNYCSWAPGMLDEHYITAAFSVKPTEKLAVCAGYAKGIQPVVDSENPFRANDNIFSVGISFLAMESCSIGFNGHYVYQKIVEDYSIEGYTMDLTVQYHGEGYNAAAGIIGLGPKVLSRKSGNSYPLPSSAKIAGDYTFALNAFKLNLAADADYYFSGNWGASAGATVSYIDKVFLRTGGRYASSGAAFPSHFAVGGGLKMDFIKLDVTYITMNPVIGNSFMGGITLDF